MLACLPLLLKDTPDNQIRKLLKTKKLRGVCFRVYQYAGVAAYRGCDLPVGALRNPRNSSSLGQNAADRGGGRLDMACGLVVLLCKIRVGGDAASCAGRTRFLSRWRAGWLPVVRRARPGGTCTHAPVVHVKCSLLSGNRR